MEMRWVAMSPVTVADCFKSTRSLGLNTTVQLPLHDHSPSSDVGFNAPVRPDGQPAEPAYPTVLG